MPGLDGALVEGAGVFEVAGCVVAGAGAFTASNTHMTGFMNCVFTIVVELTCFHVSAKAYFPPVYEVPLNVPPRKVHVVDVLGLPATKVVTGLGEPVELTIVIAVVICPFIAYANAPDGVRVPLLLGDGTFLVLNSMREKLYDPTVLFPISAYVPGAITSVIPGRLTDPPAMALTMMLFSDMAWNVATGTADTVDEEEVLLDAVDVLDVLYDVDALLVFDVE